MAVVSHVNNAGSVCWASGCPYTGLGCLFAV
jgi:hypothetical protein